MRRSRSVIIHLAVSIVILCCHIIYCRATVEGPGNQTEVAAETVTPNVFPVESSHPNSDVEQDEPLLISLMNFTHSLRNVVKKKQKQPQRNNALKWGVKEAARKGFEAMVQLYDVLEPEMIRKGEMLQPDEPGARLSMFSAPHFLDAADQSDRAAYAALYAAKAVKDRYDVDYLGLGRQAQTRLSLRRTALEGLCPSRDVPPCLPASRRYRTHDGTCNNEHHPRWGSAQMPFHRFLQPDYSDGVESVRITEDGSPLPSARFISLVVHGSRTNEAPVTMMLAQWGQFIDHDLTATAQPRSINGSVPRCCGGVDQHPNCMTIRVPDDDPWLSPLNVRCLEFLRSAPAQRRDCVLSWREQINQATSFLDGSTVYASNPNSADNNRVFRDGLLIFGRGPPRDDVCMRGALATHCFRPGDTRSGEQPGLMAMHTMWVAEHNRIAGELGRLNAHWSDEKLYQEARRIVGAMVQHITFREFLPLVLGREVCRLFDLTLETSGFYRGYDPKVNPSVANSFGAAAFRFGHSLVQGSLMRSDRNHRFIFTNVTLHEEFGKGDMGGPGSLHRLIRGMLMQRAMKRDEFISAELTNHLFQSNSFPFGLDLAAINIQRGRDHGLPSYTSWRVPCGLSPINSWRDLESVSGPESTERIRQAYRSVGDIDLFVGGLAERPVVGGLVGPTFACILAQQFSNLRKGDRFWYENEGFESSFTPAQLATIRQVTLAQVICRQVNGGTMQPHAFLPPDMTGNERQFCGEQSLIPLDLIPWTERDPLNKQHDLPLFRPQIFTSTIQQIPNNPPTRPDSNGTNNNNKKKNKNKKKRKKPTVAPKRDTQQPTGVNPKIDFEQAKDLTSNRTEAMVKSEDNVEPVIPKGNETRSSRSIVGSKIFSRDPTLHIAISWNNLAPHQRPIVKPVAPVAIHDKISSVEDEIQFLTGPQVHPMTPTDKPYIHNSPFSYDHKHNNGPTTHNPLTFWTVNDIPVVTTPQIFDVRNTVKVKPRPTVMYQYTTWQPPKVYHTTHRTPTYVFNSHKKSGGGNISADKTNLNGHRTNQSMTHTISISEQFWTTTIRNSVDSKSLPTNAVSSISTLSPSNLEPDSAFSTDNKDKLVSSTDNNEDKEVLITFTDDNREKDKRLTKLKEIDTDYLDQDKKTMDRLTKDFKTINIGDSDLTEQTESRKLSFIDPGPDKESREKTEAIAFVPLKILNSAERPDDWWIMEAPEKAPLPKVPEIATESDFSFELPSPFSLS